MEADSDNYILQTAKDYDLPVETVKNICRKSLDANDFYCKLEEEIGRNRERMD